ncbi:hypothetical protein FD644_23190 [Serratia fonticola]|uniref:hypothetical protein n=1 Tax=Serratia fonticola TaxID=47917 RepID=UPI0010CCBEF1|nr:hypothetical protein [Serratia fonticola]QCR63062.1 hypothetical protein FD644_23190 [Serratia fonticola]
MKRLFRALIEPLKVATCTLCGCDDHHACINAVTQRPCHWLAVARKAGTGVCSECAAPQPKGGVPHG